MVLEAHEGKRRGRGSKKVGKQRNKGERVREETDLRHCETR